MKLFDRIVELKVGYTDITGLHISFEIEKDLTPEPNPCHIEIYNLSEQNRQILSKYKEVPVLLKAGYKDKVGIIFKGDMIRCVHEKDGPTWKTILASGDGAMAIQTARINKSFTKGTKIKDVMQEIAKQLKVSMGSISKQLESITDEIERGLSLSGPAMEEICRMLSVRGYTVSIQNNSLQILKNGEHLAEKVISLSAESGLKASPQIGMDKTITVRSVLMPGILPGSRVHIESSTFTGLATIQSVRFTGDNFGTKWEGELQAKII